MKLLSTFEEYAATGKVRIGFGNGVVLDTGRITGGGVGSAIQLTGTVPTAADLPTTGTDSEAYVVEATGDLWVWSPTEAAFLNLGPFRGPAPTDQQIDAAVTRAVTEGRVADAALLPDNGAKAVGKGELFVAVRDYGAVGDGVTDDSAALAQAVAAAKSNGRSVYWGPGTYFTPAGSSVPDLHTVRHAGPGAVAAGSFTFYPAPVSGQANTLYVDVTGSDTNDGLHTSRPFREVRAAVAALKLYASPLRGSWKVKVAAGTYKGGITVPTVRNGSQDDFLKIEGPTVGHPNVPTAIIDKAADTAATYGFMATDGTTLDLRDLKVVGGFGMAVDIRRDVYLWLRNFHGDGQNTGSVGVGVNSHCRYYVAGGRLENYTTNGIQELFGIVRSFNNVTATADQMVIRNCEVGIQAKEGCVGHLDYLTVEDCKTGVEMNGYCVVNSKAITLKRNTLGYANVNSEVHNEDGIVWGTGADANTRDFITLGAGQELSVSGWADSATARTMNVGHRALVTVAADYVDRTVSSTTETTVVSFTSVLKARRYTTAGKQYRVTARGRVNTAALIGDYRLLMRIHGIYLIDVKVPAGTPAGAVFTATWTVICSADGNNQKAFSELSVNGTGSTGYVTRTQDMQGGPRSVALSGIAGAAGDSITVHTTEVWG